MTIELFHWIWLLALCYFQLVPPVINWILPCTCEYQLWRHLPFLYHSSGSRQGFAFPMEIKGKIFLVSALEELGVLLAALPAGGLPRVCPTLGLLGPQLHLRDAALGQGQACRRLARGWADTHPCSLICCFLRSS